METRKPVLQKKRGKDELLVLTAFVTCFAFMAFISVVFPGVRVIGNNVDGKNAFSVDGLNAVFGGNVSMRFGAYEEVISLSFSFVPFLAYLLTFIAVVLSVISFRKRSKVLYVLNGILLIFASILLLFSGFFFKLTNEKAIVEAFTLIGSFTYHTYIGPIFSIGLAAFAGIISCYTGISQK